MSDMRETTQPPDNDQRRRALDPARSILVRAPAGSGKTELLTKRFLRLLSTVNEPGEIVAITFTRAAAAEMRHRIVEKLEKAAEPVREVGSESEREMLELAACALSRSEAMGWRLVDLPAQLRIMTIDSFCRELALQQPLLAGLGGSLDIAENTGELYLRAARRALKALGGANAALSAAIEALLLWRDNNWAEMEGLLVEMLKNRDRWMHHLTLEGDQDWNGLRTRLERSLASAAAEAIHYTDPEWAIVCACFRVLRQAVAELKVVFAEAGTADYTEVAQIAAAVLNGESGIPGEGALGVAENIQHLLVDEFQDTSRKQHRLLESLIAVWPSREGRTCFVVGDPMQSIYLFRDADSELFGRVEQLGLEIPGDLPLMLEPVQLTANFRTAPELVATLNETFEEAFSIDDGSGVTFARAGAARDAANDHPAWASARGPRMELHVEFMPASRSGKRVGQKRERIHDERRPAQEKQTAEIVELIRRHVQPMEDTRRRNAEKTVGEKEKYRVAVLARKRNALKSIAAALRDAKIPFRAVKLEALQDRPEVMDALAVGRAVMNGEDRTAWMSVLRAPWCGLQLDDLHTLVSADDDSLIQRTVPELMKERAQLLSADGRLRVERMLAAFASVHTHRLARPSAPLGTWLEQVWLSLGGSACVGTAGRANVDLLWRTLDALPEGEQDLVGPTLNAALGELYALPDPSVDPDCGVQLMTIHGAKGLEFEVVIVPELQAGNWKGEQRMLTWMERGILDPEDAEEPTELLIAPIQSKGKDRGKAKEWVDREYREREKQEMRRILYVAATRAREELHLFARPEYKPGEEGIELAPPAESLLKTAWPALKQEIVRQFDLWKPRQADELVDLAAAAANVIEMPARANANVENAHNSPRRLPAGWIAPLAQSRLRAKNTPIAGARLYERHEGGLVSRALGRAVHVLLQHAAALRVNLTWDQVRSALEEMKPRVGAEIRASGIEPSDASQLATQALAIAVDATGDTAGRWILDRRDEGQSEIRWAESSGTRVRMVQADRVFKAGDTPLSETGDIWWIVDYKTVHEEGVPPAQLRHLFASQLEAYARVLRNLRGADTRVCAALYYPRMNALDWWVVN